MTRRRTSTPPLRAARAWLLLAWGAVLAVVAMAAAHPLLLGAVACSLAAGTALSGATGPVCRALRFAVPTAVLFAVINALVVRDGLTVIYRLGEVPPLGQVDITLEALVWGLVLGVRLALVVCVVALIGAIINGDELVRILRRLAPRAGLTSGLALRTAPVLAADGRRMALAQRTRAAASEQPSAADRLAIVRAVTTNALDRSLDLAATMELRGSAAGVRPAALQRPWSRVDQAFAVGVWGMAAAAVALVVLGMPSLTPYPELVVTSSPTAAAVCAVFVLAAVAPFVLAWRRGR